MPSRPTQRHTWTHDSALAELDRLIATIPNIASTARTSPEWTRWRSNVRSLLSEVFGEDSFHFRVFVAIPWGSQRGVLDLDDLKVDRMGRAESVSSLLDRKHQAAAKAQLGIANGYLLAARDDLVRKGLDGIYRGHNTAPEASAIMKIITLTDTQLRKAIRATPSDEKTVQDVMETLLLGAQVAYSREKERFEYSSKGYVPDFVVPKLNLAIEIKLCPTAVREKEIIAEINDDVAAYATKYANQLFVVYDICHIRDADKFTAALQSRPGVIVRVVKH